MPKKPYPNTTPAFAENLIADIEVGLPAMRAHRDILSPALAKLVDLDQLEDLHAQLIARRTDYEGAKASASVSHIRAVCEEQVKNSRAQSRTKRRESRAFFDEKISMLEAEIKDLRAKRSEADQMLAKAAADEQAQLRETRNADIARVQSRLDETMFALYQAFKKTREVFLRSLNLFESAAVGRADEAAVLRAIHR